MTLFMPRQGWNMFASVSMEGHWWVIIGEADTVDGPMRVDLLAWLREGAAGWRALSANEDAPGFMRRPGNVASLYRNHRYAPLPPLAPLPGGRCPHHGHMSVSYSISTVVGFYGYTLT